MVVQCGCLGDACSNCSSSCSTIAKVVVVICIESRPLGVVIGSSWYALFTYATLTYDSSASSKPSTRSRLSALGLLCHCGKNILLSSSEGRSALSGKSLSQLHAQSTAHICIGFSVTSRCSNSNRQDTNSKTA